MQMKNHLGWDKQDNQRELFWGEGTQLWSHWKADYEKPEKLGFQDMRSGVCLSYLVQAGINALESLRRPQTTLPLGQAWGQKVDLGKWTVLSICACV